MEIRLAMGENRVKHSDGVDGGWEGGDVIRISNIPHSPLIS